MGHSCDLAILPMTFLHVIVIGPAGQGGIHRMMEALRLELAGPDHADIDAEFVASHRGSPATSPLHVIRVVARLVTRRPDVAHINLSIRGSTWRKIFIAGVCWRLRVPYVIHLHGSNFHTFREKSPLWFRRRIDRLFRLSARIVVLGRIWRDFVAAWAPEAADRIDILPNAVADPGPRVIGDREKLHILFAGRLGARKGVTELVAALAAIRDQDRWRATLAGDGEIAETRTAVYAEGIGDRVDIPGWVDADGMDALMRDADILALPSFEENLPMSVVEAFANEVAVVCTPVGAVTDIVDDGVTGLLVRPGDSLGLSAALRRLLEDDEFRRLIARNGRKVFNERLDISVYAQRIVEIWRKAARVESQRSS